MAERPPWTFITSHGTVLLEVARTPHATVREIAERAGLTERQAHRVLSDLAGEAYLVRERVGRRNHYRMNPERPLRHPSFSAHQIGELLSALE